MRYLLLFSCLTVECAESFYAVAAQKLKTTEDRIKQVVAVRPSNGARIARIAQPIPIPLREMGYEWPTCEEFWLTDREIILSDINTQLEKELAALRGFIRDQK